MSTNLSKHKRDDLLSKISAIRAYIAAAPQDENTGNLLTYLSDLEKDVDGKKYGLVFEEHQEAIDTVLAEHTPVLTEEPSLLIDNGGEMNFLLEGITWRRCGCWERPTGDELTSSTLIHRTIPAIRISSMTTALWTLRIPFVTANGCLL